MVQFMHCNISVKQAQDYAFTLHVIGRVCCYVTWVQRKIIVQPAQSSWFSWVCTQGGNNIGGEEYSVVQSLSVCLFANHNVPVSLLAQPYSL